MPILAGDIKLVSSQVMDDVIEGGGAPTSNVIQDAVSNAIFPDISELDRAGGRVNLRKVFASIQTDDTDSYLGGNIIVAVPPEDPRVAVTLFTTRDVFDRREAARNRIESYLAPGPELPSFLLENHIIGQRTIQVFQRPNVELADIGRTLVLTFNEGLSTQRQQYVRVIKATAVERTFTFNGNQDYQALVVTYEISDPLRFDFPGSPPARDFARQTTKTGLRDTVVADAGTYAGVVPIVESVAIGDLSAKAESIFTQLVPSAQTETPVIDANAAGEFDTLIDSSSGIATLVSNLPFNSQTNLYLGNPVYPGTLSIAYPGGTLTDEGGQVFAGTTVVGVIDYARGLIMWASTSPGFAGTKTVSFRYAGAPLKLADSGGIDVELPNRSFNYIFTIDPPPQPGTVRVSYRAQGKWYDLRDNGAGVLSGSDSAFGRGTVSYVTGTVSVTLGALPDVGSTVLFFWGSKSNYFNRASSLVAPATLDFQLANGGVTPGSLMVTWGIAPDNKMAVDDGKGMLTGDATGRINYKIGLVNLAPLLLPNGGTEFSVSYDYGPPDVQAFPSPARDGIGRLNLQLDKTDIQPGSVEIDYVATVAGFQQNEFSYKPGDFGNASKTLRDDGLGALRDELGVSFGTINYVTGLITFQPDFDTTIPQPEFKYFTESRTYSLPYYQGGGVSGGPTNVPG